MTHHQRLILVWTVSLGCTPAPATSDTSDSQGETSDETGADTRSDDESSSGSTASSEEGGTSGTSTTSSSSTSSSTGTSTSSASTDPGTSTSSGTSTTGTDTTSTTEGDESVSGEDGPETGDPFDAPFILGADISSVHENNYTFRDTDGQTKSIFDLLKNHGFNYIRVKAFVDPSAPYGYASTSNGCSGFPEPFSDRDHVVAFGQQIKAAGMGFLLNFHYSDVWADPGNQIIPDPWRDNANIEALAEDVHAYTTDVVRTAVMAGARPDMVQIGNEITPGMLMHVPGPNTDCWGNNPAQAPFGGAANDANWGNLATLLNAGIDAVRAIDPTIKIMLHIENTDELEGVRWWVDSALSHGVDFDVLGLSCYAAFQGPPSVWETTFEALAAEYADLEFVVAEYNPERTAANLMMRDLPDGRGLGTFFWEPTRGGEWGNSMFTQEGNTLVANPSDFAEFDTLRAQLGL